MNLSTVGSAITYAKFTFLPRSSSQSLKPEGKQQKLNYWWAIAILLSGLFLANGFYLEAYSLSNLIKPLIIVAAGWLAYIFVFSSLTIKLSSKVETFDNLIGAMSLMLILIFWILWMELQFSI